MSMLEYGGIHMRSYFSQRTAEAVITFAVTFCVIPSAVALAGEAYTDTFDGGENPNAWTFGPGDEPQSSGGNPDGYLGAITFDYAVLRTERSETFLGDWRARNVSELGFDFITFARLHGAWAPHPMVIMLTTDNGTPENGTDDWAAYTDGAGMVPAPGEGWRSFHWSVDTQSVDIPAGWETVDLGIFPPRTHDWAILTSHVTQLAFWTITPGEPTNFPGLRVGTDNIRIAWSAAPCLGDLDGDGVVGLSDLTLLLSHFGATEAEAADGDLDGDADVDLADLTILLSRFGAICA